MWEAIIMIIIHLAYLVDEQKQKLGDVEQRQKVI